MILGHAHPEVVQGGAGSRRQRPELRRAHRSSNWTWPNCLCKLLPGMEQVRLVSSGTEATMSAIRLARGFTGRTKIIKFEGCYHGHADSCWSRPAPARSPSASPAPAACRRKPPRTPWCWTYNDAAALAEAFAEIGNEIAAVIVEPVAGNMNLVAPKPEFLKAMRELCTQHGAC